MTTESVGSPAQGSPTTSPPAGTKPPARELKRMKEQLQQAVDTDTTVVSKGAGGEKATFEPVGKVFRKETQNERAIKKALEDAYNAYVHGGKKNFEKHVRNGVKEVMPYLRPDLTNKEKNEVYGLVREYLCKRETLDNHKDEKARARVQKQIDEILKKLSAYAK